MTGTGQPGDRELIRDTRGVALLALAAVATAAWGHHATLALTPGAVGFYAAFCLVSWWALFRRRRWRLRGGVLVSETQGPFGGHKERSIGAVTGVDVEDRVLAPGRAGLPVPIPCHAVVVELEGRERRVLAVHGRRSRAERQAAALRDRS